MSQDYVKEIEMDDGWFPWVQVIQVKTEVEVISNSEDFQCFCYEIMRDTVEVQKDFTPERDNGC